MSLYNRLRERNVKLVTVDDRMVYTFDKLEEIVRLLFKADNDNAYAKTVSLNALRGNARAARLGRCHQRFPPYGMMKLVVTDDKEERIIPRTKSFNKPKDWLSYLIPGDPIEQDVVRAMFTMFRDRDVSYSEMVRFFTTHPNLKYRLGPTGDGWHEQTVRHILGNLHYAGYEFIAVETSGEHHRFCGDQVIVAEEFKENDPLIVDITQPGIGHPKQGIVVDRETLFWPVQEKLKRRAAQPTKPKTSTLNPDGYALTGIVRCGNCGKPMYGHHNQGRGTLYTCKSARKGICGFWSVKEDDILPWLLAKIDMEVWRQLEAKPELPEACDDHSGVADDIVRLDRKIAVLKGKINAADDPDVIDSMAELLATAIKQRKELEAQATKIDRVEQLLFAQDRWEGFITPMLVPVKTGSVGAGEEALMDELGIEQGEVDRLLNYTLVRPSSVRETLRSYNTEVKLWFKEAPQGRQATGHRKQWEVDMGRLDAKIGSIRLTPDTCLTDEPGPNLLAVLFAAKDFLISGSRLDFPRQAVGQVAGVKVNRVAGAVVPPVLGDQLEELLHPSWPIFCVPIHFPLPPSGFVTGVPKFSGVPRIW